MRRLLTDTVVRCITNKLLEVLFVAQRKEMLAASIGEGRSTRSFWKLCIAGSRRASYEQRCWEEVLAWVFVLFFRLKIFSSKICCSVFPSKIFRLSSFSILVGEVLSASISCRNLSTLNYYPTRDHILLGEKLGPHSIIFLLQQNLPMSFRKCLPVKQNQGSGNGGTEELMLWRRNGVPPP